MARNDGDQVITLTPAQRIQFDVIDALRAPKITVCFTTDITALVQRLEEWSREHRLRITLNTAVIKAAALTLKKFPILGYIPRGYRLIKPGIIAIGVSVAGAEILAPVVIVNYADSKSLVTITKEVLVKGETARKVEAENMEKLSRWARWFPSDRLRRWLIRRLLSSYRLRYQSGGNFQISNVSNIGIDWASSPVSVNTLLMIGGRERVPVVNGDRLETRSTVRMTLIGDHKTLNGRTCGEFVQEIRRILQQPEELLKEGS
ncbi:MAG: 2-oxo acid dehydrogenase subunit E2 [Acidobacteria bacterium]|nr:2-oxo acid dehydrogenase subunit E2 [Acidobacteriota bacterium]MBI3655853.1 2-oxo acid dehydrogenase subunit E2 [Acidobacteriota bacterium]